MATGTEAYQSSIDQINEGIAQTNSAFKSWIEKVVAVLRGKGYTIKYRLDYGGDQVFSTTATCQMDGTKEGITARAAYTAFHMKDSPTTGARLMETAWYIAKNSANLNFAPTVGGDPADRDPILHQTTYNYNPEVEFATTQFGEPAVSLPPTNQPGQTNTTVPPGSEPTNSIGQSPTNPENGDQPTPPMSDDSGLVEKLGDSGGSSGGGGKSESFLDSIGLTQGQAIIAGLIILLAFIVFTKG